MDTDSLAAAIRGLKLQLDAKLITPVEYVVACQQAQGARVLAHTTSSPHSPAQFVLPRTLV
jgi:hypothetical protein